MVAKKLIGHKTESKLNERELLPTVQWKRELDKKQIAEKAESNKWENLKKLNIEPLSIAKFFYEKGIEDIAVIQRLIYLTYCEALEKENLLLFREEWQAWSGGAVVESVFYKMRSHPNRKELFKQIPSLSSPNEKFAIDYCESLFNHYQEYININEDYEFLERAHNKPWEMARRNLSNEIDKNKIKVIDIINFFNKKRGGSSLLSLLLNKLLSLWKVGEYRPTYDENYEAEPNMKNIEEITSSWKKSITSYIPYE